MNPQEFFIETPPYVMVDVGEIDKFKNEIIDTEQAVRAYCRKCKTESVFIRYANEYIMSGALRRPARPDYASNMAAMMIAHQWSYTEGFFLTDFVCSTGCGEELIFLSLVSQIGAAKCGQWPSYTDLTKKLHKKYLKVLSEERFGEFNRAVGLAAHDIGIGSFVYLRRIIEDMVEEAHKILQLIDTWDEKKYQQSHFSERLDLVRDELPNYLIENANVYGIVSKGIHELTEEECLLYFPVVRDTIEIILDEKIARIESEAKKKSISSQIAKITGELRGATK